MERGRKETHPELLVDGVADAQRLGIVFGSPSFAHRSCRGMEAGAGAGAGEASEASCSAVREQLGNQGRLDSIQKDSREGERERAGLAQRGQRGDRTGQSLSGSSSPDRREGERRWRGRISLRLRLHPHLDGRADGRGVPRRGCIVMEKRRPISLCHPLILTH